MNKILWFANTPCGATEKLTGKSVLGGGWLYALSEQIATNKDIELHIAFYWGERMMPFLHKRITYHPVLKEGEGSKLGRLINRFIDSRFNKLDLKCLPRLMQVIHEVSPDIIHIHGSEGNFGMVASQKLPCPIVLSIQGMLSPYFYKYYSGFSKQEILHNESVWNKVLMGGVSLQERTFCRRCDMEVKYFKNIPNIIGRTFWDKACSLALNPKRRYFEVGEIMRSEFFVNRWDKKSFGLPIILTTTISSGYYKGVETVYHSAKILKESGFKFQWNVIGISNDDTLAQLSEKQVGIAADKINIKLLGRMSASEMVSLMTEADIFVQVSHIENSPNSLCEAMLLGMPILATFAGGTASMLENNVEGRLLQDGEPYSMAGMIMEMASDFELSKLMGERAAEKARKRHRPEYVCNQLMGVYNKIINS